MKRVKAVVITGCLTLSINAFAQGAPTTPTEGAAQPVEGAPAAGAPAAPAPADTGVAEAAPPPPAKPPASVTLKQGATLFQATTEMNMSSGPMDTSLVAKPITLGPDISYGVTPDLTVSLVHSSAALTGFRGATGVGGVCVTGTDNGCNSVYKGGGVEGVYGLLKGGVAVGAVAGVLGRSVGPDKTLNYFSAKVGLRTRFAAGEKAFVTVNPSVWIGLNERDAMPANKERLWLPVAGFFKATPEFTVGVATGLKGPFEKLGDNYEVPLGASAQYAINKPLAVGASFVFGNLIGGNDLLAGADSRHLQVWLNYAR